MELKLMKPRLALNKAFLKVKPSRPEIELFKSNLIRMIDTINESESEEFHKNEVSDFLKNTYYSGGHFINTKGRNDLVIHNGTAATSTVGVIIEAKKPANKAEMLKVNNLNTKAFQELVLYYLRERITHKNLEIKHLIATNIYEWFVFDAQLFERVFAQNKALVKQFVDFEEGRLGGSKTEFFYTEVAAPAIANISQEISFAYFDIRDYDKPLRNNNPNDDNLLIALYKLLSPQHLLKQPFANDSNSLDKAFYSELLHIIGLTETKEGGKKLIQRKTVSERNSGSLLENTITQLDSHDKLSRIPKLSQYGSNYQEQLFNVALELVITWINRVLFLKLLEAQLVSYHKGDKAYLFLNSEKIRDFDDLDKLFFRVLAKKMDERDVQINQLFGHVPYLNSSLFEPTELEHLTLFISGLEDFATLPFLNTTVLKDATGKKISKPFDTLQYLFGFLDAYNFSSEGSVEIQEDNKRLINASVLGLIFEKINGYKDGSFFTPGFITMYMCRETIRRAVVQKFNDAKGWNCKEFGDLYDHIDDRSEANTIINSLKLCDPAVGSGHFLVSALNEIITVKSELRVLLDREGKRLKEYFVAVENDELVVTDDEGQLFEYNPNNKESQRVQETLFHEKQTIIENCLFGVDINPNSVKICRLRLWIELLKNAYYLPSPKGEGSGVRSLETLPNIDINIKCGNSLISRYALDADLKKALKSSKWSIGNYRDAVKTYRNAKSKEVKREMEKLILSIKQDFTSEIRRNDPLKTRLDKLSHELYNRFTGNFIFEPEPEYGKSSKLEKKKKEEQKKLEDEINNISQKMNEIKDNKIFENSFEWRFEFPEVLNDEGDFIGFDVVIGNPPYIPGKDLSESVKAYLKSNFEYSSGKFDVYIAFIEKGLDILSANKNLCFIIPNTFLANENAKLLRECLINNELLNSISVFDDTVFTEAFVESIILQIDGLHKRSSIEIQDKTFQLIRNAQYEEFKCGSDYRIQVLYDDVDDIIIKKVNDFSIKLGDIIDFCIGIQVGGEGSSKDFKEKYISNEKLSEEYVKMLDGKDFEPYNIKWPQKYIKYGDWLHRKRDKKYFIQPKIMIRQIGETPFATIDYDGYYTLNTIYNGIVSDDNYDIKYIYALMTSKLNKFFWRRKFSDGKALFPKVKKSQLIEIPIAKVLLAEQTPIIDIVERIMGSKKENHDTTALEAEIDQLVYELYGLTEEEIKIVEGEKNENI